MNSSEERGQDKMKGKLLASGEVSAIYGTEKDGEIEDVYVKSEYLKRAQEFLRAHHRVNNDSGLMMTMESLAMGLALIDCTGKKGLVDNSRAKSVEDYDDLQNRLNDERVSDEDKQAIREFLKVMEGKAIQVLREYCQENDISSTKKEETTKTQEVKNELEEIGAEIDKWQDFINGSVVKFDETLNELSIKMGDYSLDADRLQEQMDSLSRITEGIKHSAEMAEKVNDDYLQKLIENRGLLSEREYNDRYLWVLRSEEKVAIARQKVILMDEYEGEIQGYITRAKEALNKIR